MRARVLGREGALWRLRLSICAGGAFAADAVGGAGLEACRAVAAQMGAEVGVERLSSGAACRHLELLLSEAEAPAPLELLRPAAGPPRRVLVADDDQRNRRLLGEALVHMGHEVRFAVDGREAVQACATHRFNVVLMDMRMPVLPGDAAARLIRSDGRNRLTPIIAVTATPADDHGRPIEEAGFNDVLTKPLDLCAVRALIDRLLGA